MSSVLDRRFKEYIRISVDYGTAYLKLSTQHIYPGVTVDDAPIENVILLGHRRNVEVPQVGLCLDNGNFLFGEFRVEQEVRKNPMMAHRVIHSWKMLLAPELRHSAVVKRTMQALLGKAYQSASSEQIIEAVRKVITAHLREIKAGVIEWYKNKSMSSHTPNRDWDNLPCEAQICVPVTFEEDTANEIVRAASEAGFDRVNAREEPQCLAGACMEALMEKHYISVLDSILFVDIGGMTAQVNEMKALSAPSESGRMKLERIGDAMGNQGGSLALTEIAWTWFQDCSDVRKLGGLANVSRGLGLTIEECHRQVFKQIESIKLAFCEKGDHARIYIAGKQMWEAVNSDVIIVKIENEKIQEWHDEWAEPNIALLNEFLKRKTACRTAIFTGGGCNNKYLTDRLESKLKANGIRVLDFKDAKDFPCSRGALQHYSWQKDKPLENGFYYVVRDEEWQEDLHKDYLHFPAKYLKGLKYYHGLVPVMSVIDGKDAKACHPVPMWFSVSPDGLFDVTVYHSAHAPHPLPGSPLIDPLTGKRLPGLQKYPVEFLDPGNLAKLGRLIPKSKTSKGRHRNVYGFLEMEKNDDSVEVVVKFMKRSFTPGISEPQEHFALELKRPIWHSDRSHFVMTDVVNSNADASTASGRESRLLGGYGSSTSSANGTKRHLSPAGSAPTEQLNSMVEALPPNIDGEFRTRVADSSDVISPQYSHGPQRRGDGRLKSLSHNRSRFGSDLRNHADTRPPISYNQTPEHRNATLPDHDAFDGPHEEPNHTPKSFARRTPNNRTNPKSWSSSKRREKGLESDNEQRGSERRCRHDEPEKRARH